MEILVDPNQAECVSEAFELPDVDMTDCSHTSRTELSYHTTHAFGPRSSQNSNGKRRRMSSQRSSQRSSVADDLMACIIPGMDPSELLQLVEECAEEERREKELEESQRSHDQDRRQRRSKSSRKRVKNALSTSAS